VSAPRQPPYIRLANRAGAGLARAGVQSPALDASKLLARAERRTGLSDFGDDSFREGLERLARGLADEANLSQVGRIVAHYNLVDHLCVRLRLIAYRRHRPEVARQEIKRPVFILGLPRTGTTILFELLAQDPAMRAPASWEVAKPVPPPATWNYDTDKRRAQVARLLPVMEKLAPGFRRIHAIDAHLPQECVYLLASHFMSEQFAYMYNLPRYRQWLLESDMGPAYRWHRDFLQHLQVDCPGERWVLKSPAHLGYLETLLAQYPDACIIWTHRRPLDAMASFASLTSTLHGGFSAAVDPRATARQEVAHYARVTSTGLAQRERLGEAHFFDAGFNAICEDPLSVVRDIYDHFSLPLTPEVVERMQRYLAQRPRHLYGEHRYSAPDFGLRPDTDSANFPGYLDRFSDYL
jgi:hypothetical protein